MKIDNAYNKLVDNANKMGFSSISDYMYNCNFTFRCLLLYGETSFLSQSFDLYNDEHIELIIYVRMFASLFIWTHFDINLQFELNDSTFKRWNVLLNHQPLAGYILYNNLVNINYEFDDNAIKIIPVKADIINETNNIIQYINLAKCGVI